MKKAFLIVPTVLAIAVAFAIGYISTNNSAFASRNVDSSLVNLDTDPMIGDPDAPVTLVYFEDYKCPHCATFSENVAPIIEREYVETGKAKVYFKNFTVMGAESERLALVGECVADQSHEAFWDFTKRAFRITNLTEESALQDLDNLDHPDLNVEEVHTCVENDELLNRVNTDQADALAIELGGTPSVLVNDATAPSGIDGLRSAIDEALAEAD